MKKWLKILLVTCTFYITIVIITNIVIVKNNSKSYTHEYRAEVNRIYTAYADSGIMPSMNTYDYVKAVSVLDVKDCTEEERTNFFNQKNKDTTIRTISENGIIKEYILFEYDNYIDDNDVRELVVVNVTYGISTIIIILLLLYIRNSIIKPFHKIENFPEELSKGHLTMGLKENSDRTFGRFVWGLNMLKDNLEDNKAHSLELEKEKKTLILSISHDIKTPLSAIKLYSQALKENLYADSSLGTEAYETKVRETAAGISNNADKIEQFVTEIVDTTKNDFLHISVHMGEFYISTLYTTISEYYREKMALLMTEFTIGEYENCLLKGDIDKVVEAIENIVENAIKYGDGRYIHISTREEEDMEIITIANSGCTLKKNELVHIYESFYRGTNATDKKGSGLGLYICREIMYKMNGDIYADIENDEMRVSLVIPKC